ncbi:unnamed protein product [Tuber aestivum]|uniref:DUF726 domain-containing protein n=1 Tax=Tuber aestivum TaxID=59557 RepID=A0A292PMP0_9PEZI|nr:unnamed protein product [Tuber aestivum]
MSGRRTNNGSSTEGQDLVHLLSTEQCGEFMILASTITERMRKSIGEVFEAVEQGEALKGVGEKEVRKPGVGEEKGDEIGDLLGFGEVKVGGSGRDVRDGERRDWETEDALPEPMEHTPAQPPARKKAAKMESLSRNPLEEEDLPSRIGELSISDASSGMESQINPPGGNFEGGSGDESKVLRLVHDGDEDSDGELQMLAPEPIEHFPEATPKQVDAEGAQLPKTPDVATPPPVPPLAAAGAEGKNPSGKRPIPKRTTTPKLRDLRRKALASHDEWAFNVLRRIGEALNAPGSPRSTNANRGPQGQVLKWPEIYKPVPAPLTSPLSLHSAGLVVQAVLLHLLSLGKYDARSLASSLRVPADVVIALESEIAKTLIAVSKQMNADAESKKRANEAKFSRRWKVGLASVAGAAVIGVTGGLAAPFVAAGIGGLLSGLGLSAAVTGCLGAVAGSGAIMGALFGAYGAKMTGEMAKRYAAEVKDFAFVPLRNSDSRLRVTIGITGWLTNPDEVTLPWKALNGNSEVYSLRWEMEALLDLGTSLQEVLKSYAWSYIKLEIIKRTVLAPLWAAIWPVALLRAARVIDNPFSIAKHRSEKAGRVLADAIINKAQGERPVTLIGFSLGARVIYYCLQSLAERGAYGLVENVVLMGAPVPSSGNTWIAVRAVVAGRVVNVYSEKDYILGFLYRTSSVQLGIAGLQPVKVSGIENFDAGNRVEGHLKYRHVVGVILKEIFGHDVDAGEVSREEEILRMLELKDEQDERERKEHDEKGRGSDDVDGEISSALERAERELERKLGREEEEVRRKGREGGRGEI